MTLAFAVPPFTLWHDELWDTILDLSALLDDGTWVLVGGQAVVAHALAHAGVDHRMPREPDQLGRLVTVSSAMPTVARTFRHLGFEPERQPVRAASEFRFRREAEGPGADQYPQVWAVHVVGVTELHGGDQALARRVPYEVNKGMRAPLVPVPDLLSTVVYEASQFAVDTADPFVHARDTAFLVSLLDDPIRERSRLTPADRRALRVLDAAVGSHDHHVWSEPQSDRDAYARWRRLLAV